jgi:hypothetical protein
MGWINKQRNIMDFALNSLLRRKGKNFALLVVYTGIIFLVSSIVFSSESIKRESRILLENSPEIVVQRTIAGRHDLIPEQYIERLRSIRGVHEAKGRLWGYYFEPGVQANYTLVVPDEFIYGPGYIVIGNGVSKTLTVPMRVWRSLIFSLLIQKSCPLISFFFQVMISER